MKRPVKITVEEATEIHRSLANGPMTRCTIAYAGQWYDIRGLSDADIEAFLVELLGEGNVPPPEKRGHIDVRL